MTLGMLNGSESQLINEYNARTIKIGIKVVAIIFLIL
jgi:hypothetical protein